MSEAHFFFLPLNEKLLPLNGAGGLGAYVVDDTIDALNLIDDAVGESAQEIVGEVSPVGGHPVSTGDGTDANDVFIGARIAHDTDRFYR